jgi:Domain of unknown function (DUF305)
VTIARARGRARPAHDDAGVADEIPYSVGERGAPRPLPSNDNQPGRGFLACRSVRPHHPGRCATGHNLGKSAMNMNTSYRSLALQTVIGGIIMYLVMFVMIDRLSSFYNNLNMVYMTLMMVAPMVVLMIVFMPGMFKSKAVNAALLIGSVVIFFGSFALIRTQTTIGDSAFLRSMIPHHSGAILMCEQAKLRDPQVAALCTNIIKSQRDEIAQMKAMLDRR